MQKCLLLVFLPIVAASCKTGGNSNHSNDNNDPSKIYKLRLNPADGSSYHYDIANETSLKAEIEEKKMESISKTNVGITYTIHKDSAGNFLLGMNYSTIHLYSKKNDEETEFDANTTSSSANEVERMLAILKGSKIISTVNPAGQTIKLTGYKETGDSIINSIGGNDVTLRNMLQSQWEKTIGKGLIKKNLVQLFEIFPDSAVHLGDTWKLNSKEEAELSLQVKNIYTLKAINPSLALIHSSGNIKTDNASMDGLGLTNVVADLRGEQEGEYEMETATGMLISSRVNTKVEGVIKISGREIPVKINLSVKITGKKEK